MKIVGFILAWMLVLRCWMPMVVAQRLASQTVKGLRGDAVTLGCFSRLPPKGAIPRPTITWVKGVGEDAVDVATSVSGIPHISAQEYQGRTKLKGGNLTISSLKIADSGLYTCKVTAIKTSPSSFSIRLVVTATPEVSISAYQRPNVEPSGNYVAATCLAKQGKPQPNLKWTNQNNQIQLADEKVTRNSDGTWNVRSSLLLLPGLLGRQKNATHPVTNHERVQDFVCHVEHEYLPVGERTKTVAVAALYSPITHISLLGNRMTCHAQGNPQPSVKWFLPSGHVITDVTSLYLGQSENDNGRYACLASSSLKPDSIEIMDVQRARGLPSLFRTLEKLDTSLPTTASGYEITCSAELDLSNKIQSFEFDWRKNGDQLDREVYEITTRLDTGGSRHSNKLMSTLRFSEVVRGRDDAIFQCRLLNRSRLTGFVTALERSVNISVDYAPMEVSIQSHPSKYAVVEGKTLTLNCSSISQPISTKAWYHNGVKIATGDTLTINGINRMEAGSYRCVAYNYVPGSSSADVTVTVLYPPSDIAVEELPGMKIACGTLSGSVPPPVYSWIYPNQTYIRGNTSVIKLLDPPPRGKSSYTCLVTNFLGVTVNATYDQHAIVAKRFGNLSIAEFTITMVVCFVMALLLVGLIAWLVYRKRKITAERKSDDKTFKKYLRYAGAPNSTGVLSSERTPFSASSSIAQSYQQESICKTTCTNESSSSPAKETQPSIRSPVPTNLACTSITMQPPASCVRSIKDLNTPQSHSTKNYRSFSDVDGSSIEITAIESLHSTATNPNSQDISTKITEENGKASPEKAPEVDPEATGDCAPSSRSCNATPTSARLASLRLEVANRFHEQPPFTVQYLPRATLPRTNISRAPGVHQRNRLFATGAFSPYDPVILDATWCPPVVNFPQARSNFPPSDADPKKIHFTPDLFTHAEETTSFEEQSEDYLDGGRNTSHQRVSSLSTSMTSNQSYSQLPSREDAASYHPAEAEVAELRAAVENGYSFSQLNTDDSEDVEGNEQSLYSVFKKPQSLTLV